LSTNYSVLVFNKPGKNLLKSSKKEATHLLQNLDDKKTKPRLATPTVGFFVGFSGSD
jgi:hypothetical protein